MPIFLTIWANFYLFLPCQFAKFSANLEYFENDCGIDWYQYFPIQLSIVKKDPSAALVNTDQKHRLVIQDETKKIQMVINIIIRLGTWGNGVFISHSSPASGTPQWTFILISADCGKFLKNKNSPMILIWAPFTYDRKVWLETGYPSHLFGNLKSC